MGLNLYESRAYLALLNGKQLSAKQIGRTAMIPASRTYDVLESLATKGFALGTPSSPKLYTPVPFEQVVPSHYKARKQIIQADAARMNELAQTRLEELTGAYEGLMQELKDTVRSDFRVPEPVWVLEGRDNIERTLVSLIQGSKSDITRITRPPDMSGNYPPDPFYLWMANWTHVRDALERGVRVRYLSLARELPSYPGLKVSEPPERRFLLKDEEIIEKFFMADDNVLLNLYDPKLSAFGSVAMFMRSEAACAVFREHFEAMWNKARPLKDELPGVKAMVADVCARMSEAGFSKSEVTLYRVMAEIGACTDAEITEAMHRRRVGQAESASAFTKLAGQGFVHKNRAIRVSMVENPSVVLAALDAKH